MSSYLDIREALEETPCINGHLHQTSHEGEEFPSNGDALSYVSEYFHENMPGMGGFKWSGASGREAWKLFLSAWPQLRCTGGGRVASAKLRRLGLSDDLTLESYDEIPKRLRKHTPDEARNAYKHAGIRGSLTDVLGHPCFGGLKLLTEFLEGIYKPIDGFFPLLHTNDFHDINTPQEFQQIEHVIGSEFHSLDDMKEKCCSLVQKAAKLGLVGLKDTRAYTRGVGYDAPDRGAAQAAFLRLRNGHNVPEGDNSLSNYMFDALVACASDLGLTVAIHTGFIFSVNAKSNANQLHNLIERFPNVRFDLYHLNYPWVDEIYYILSQYQNTTANCVWAEYIDPAGTEAFLYRCLGSLSANRVIAYGSDGGGLDFVLASLSLTKDLIAAALSRLVDRSQISKSSALEVARIWLYEAPVEAFKLKCD